MHGSGRIGREPIDAADRPFGKGGIKRDAPLGGEGDDFLHGRQQHAAGFGNGARTPAGSRTTEPTAPSGSTCMSFCHRAT